MPKFYQFRKRDESSTEDAEKEAESLGLFDIYKIEDFNSHQMLIGGFATDVNLEHISHLKLDSTSDSIDWERQSELFSPYYKNGRVEIPLKDFAMTDTLLTLTPGGGFGDMSHPTTKLALGLLEKRVHGKTVLDIGCGNGILSFAAKLLGAAFVNGIDIDSQALEHAQINRSLNCLDEIVISTIPDEKIAIAKELVCLMNMTFAEQRCAFASIKDIGIKPITLITSGILIEQRDRYLTWLKDLGFSLLQEQQQDGWMAFVLNNRGQSCESYPQL